MPREDRRDARVVPGRRERQNPRAVERFGEETLTASEHSPSKEQKDGAKRDDPAKANGRAQPTARRRDLQKENDADDEQKRARPAEYLAPDERFETVEIARLFFRQFEFLRRTRLRGLDDAHGLDFFLNRLGERIFRRESLGVERKRF